MNNPRKSKPETNLPIPWNWCLGSWKVWKFGNRLSLPSHKRMYSEEPSLRRLNCIEVETGQRGPPLLDVFSSFIHGWDCGMGDSSIRWPWWVRYLCSYLRDPHRNGFLSWGFCFSLLTLSYPMTYSTCLSHWRSMKCVILNTRQRQFPAARS